MQTFVPVVGGSRGRRGLPCAPTRRLVALTARYRAMEADPAAPPAVRRYAGEVLAEIHAELDRRHGTRPGKAAA